MMCVKGCHHCENRVNDIIFQPIDPVTKLEEVLMLDTKRNDK